MQEGDRMSLLRHALSLVLPVILIGAASSAEIIDYRLPSDVIPTLYTIELEPNIVPGDFTFAGRSWIDIEVKSEISEIVLHAKDLTIEEDYTSLLIDNERVENLALTFAHENVTDFYKIKLSEPIYPDNYTLQMKYTGSLHDDLYGFYRSWYINDEGEKIWLALTHFEPTSARRAFPCFDEPAFKAKFKIFFKHLKNYTAISNMPVIWEMDTRDSLHHWTEFDITPVMSTYLVAFVVSDFPYLSANNDKFRVYSRKNALETGKFALSFGPKALQFLENYTGIKQPLPKIDNVAIPQFAMGGMENWGIITYGETELLYDENTQNTKKKQNIAKYISHELAHQWFGNLVTPSWWRFTWLNEGFAEYFEYFVIDKIEPTWRLMDQYVVEKLQRIALIADDRITARPMDVDVNSAESLSNIFVTDTYSKASSVLRSFSHILKETAFRSGLQNYLRKYAYSTANSTDLFECLQEAANMTDNVDLIAAFTSWVTQPGYPVVTVIRDHGSGDATISQKRFLKEPSGIQKELWYIPLNYASEDDLDFDDTTPMRWMSDTTLSISGLPTDKWVVFNKQQTGLYRVNYDSQNWKLIADCLRNPDTMNDIHVLNRAQLLDDSFQLAQARELPNHLAFLELSEYLQHEDDYIPWLAAYRSFIDLNMVLVNTEKYHLFKLYVLRLLNKLEETVGYEECAEDDHTTKFVRGIFIELACKMGSARCLKITHDKLIQHISGSRKISADYWERVLYGALSDDTTVWDAVYNLAVEMEPQSEEQNLIVGNLGWTSDRVILTKFLEKALLTNSTFDRNSVMMAVRWGSPAAIDIAFDFFARNYQVIIELDGDISFISKCLRQMAARITTTTQIKRLEGFIESLRKNNDILAKDLETRIFSKAKKNVKWVNEYGPAISAFLDAQKLVDDESSSCDNRIPTLLTGATAVIGSGLNRG